MNFDQVTALGETVQIAKDFSQYSNNATVYNALPRTANGKRGGAYNFGTLGEYISVPDSALFTLTNNYTVSAWINPDDIANRTKCIM